MNSISQLIRRLPTTVAYSPLQFALWRISFGAYLAYYFARMLPHAADVFSNQGMLPDAHLNPTYGLFPGIFLLGDSPQFVVTVHVLLLCASLCIMTGLFRRSAAALTWYGHASLAHRNFLIIDPSFAFIGWLLLACAIIPAGETLSISKRDTWHMPASIYYGALCIVGLAYSASGIERLLSASWRDGSAVAHLLQLPIAHTGTIHAIAIAMPEWMLTVQSYSAVALFVGALPLLLIPHTRLFAWITLTAMFIYMGIMLDLTQVILGLMITHAFLFDQQWIRPMSLQFEYIATRMRTHFERLRT